jgi:hypothetical protein
MHSPDADSVDDPPVPPELGALAVVLVVDRKRELVTAIKEI